MKERRGPAAAAKGLEDEVALFKKRTPGSAKAYEAARRWTVYGVHSNYRVLDPYPLYAKRAKGARIWDVDGNAYLDFSMAFGALVAGHSHPTLVKAMREAPWARRFTAGFNIWSILEKLMKYMISWKDLIWDLIIPMWKSANFLMKIKSRMTIIRTRRWLKKPRILLHRKK